MHQYEGWTGADLSSFVLRTSYLLLLEPTMWPFFEQALSYDAIARTYEAALAQSAEYSAAIPSSRASTS